MKPLKTDFVRIAVLSILVVILVGCASPRMQQITTPVSTETTKPISTNTITPRPSFTLRPSETPNLTATQKVADLRTATAAYFDAWKAETQKYYDLGYLSTTDGTNRKYVDFVEEWAQLNWYRSWIYEKQAENFYVSAHFKWSSAYRNADVSGCGYIFAIQENGDHYAVFLDRSKILFLNADQTSGYSRAVGLTRGTGRVKFDNPADTPQEADFTIIVNGTYTYVLVDEEVVGEYTLAKSKILRGDVGLSLLSGTNKDYGTRCVMTEIRLWIPNS
jgi:hypothetical protein